MYIANFLQNNIHFSTNGSDSIWRWSGQFAAHVERSALASRVKENSHRIPIGLLPGHLFAANFTERTSVELVGVASFSKWHYCKLVGPLI